MIVDRRSRDFMANAIEDYLDGRIDNWTLDDAHMIVSDDAMCQEFAEAIYFFYDDCSRHTNAGRHSIAPDENAMLRRWIELLRSDVVWQWARTPHPTGFFSKLISVFNEKPPYSGNLYWPFPNESDFREWEDRHNNIG